MATISVLTVTYNARDFIAEFLASVQECDSSGIELEILVIDNGSTDGTVSWLRENQAGVTLLENDENNYARALNLGVENSSGDFVVIANNDATVDRQWLQGLLEVCRSDPGIGAVQSKIFFTGGKRLNSVGVEETEHFYYRDIGFEEEDSPRFAHAEERKFLTGGSLMLRRECLDDVGPWDEEFIMFMEDVDYSQRCRNKGWKLWYAPRSLIYHAYHGTASAKLCEYFCSRNRFLFVAKHFPRQLPACIPSSHFLRKGEFDSLYRVLLHATRKLLACQDSKTATQVLQSLKECLPSYLGDVSTHNFFSQLELMLGLRKIRVGIYDHAGHFAGGGQRYVAEMATVMQDRYDVTYIFNKDVELSEYKKWFDIDLGRCAKTIIPIPFFEQRNRFVADEAMVVAEPENPFDVIARESLNYDIFINANMLGKVNPLALTSLFVCHFPDQKKQRFFQVDKYDYLLINGDYTGGWVKKRWQLEPTHKLYPPVHMADAESSVSRKEKLILSVSRFEVGGSKKQVELVRAFRDMCRQEPDKTAGWKLVLLGGSTPENAYLEQVMEAAEKSDCAIEVRPNVTVDEVREHYRQAAIFWHACGLGERRPEKVEHFGMTTVEAMQNGCVPIVIDGGGQREIVVHGESGYRFGSLQDLRQYSLKVMGDSAHRQSIGEKACQRSQLFNRDAFRGRLASLLAEVEAGLLGREVLPD